MRDPKRIPKFCNDLAALWMKVPDWRFGQFIVNLWSLYAEQTKKDIFFIEDDELMDFMQKHFKE